MAKDFLNMYLTFIFDMIKKTFNDGCLGVKLLAEEIRDEKTLLRSLRDISPLTSSDTEILVSNILFKEQDTKLFPESGYRVGWKRSLTMSYVVVVFCPMEEEEESATGSSEEAKSSFFR